MEYATLKMNEFRKEAEDILLQFPPSVYRTGLEQLMQFTIDRNN